jgi:hypothetical protein
MSEEKLVSLISLTFGADKEARIVVQGKRIEVQWGNWSLRAYYESGPDVREESQEIASGYASRREDKGRLALCDKWITIASDSDYDMKHFNHFVFLLQGLEEHFPGSVLFVPEEGAFFDAGEFN